jgi:membrane-associated phospholipid phosphatase
VSSRIDDSASGLPHRRARALRQAPLGRPWLVLSAVVVAVALGVVAAVHGGRLLVWDPMVTDLFVGWRSPAVDRAARWVSRLGSTPVVITAGVAGIVLAARRCRFVALVMLVAVATRPPFEWLLKEVVGRPRPDGARLVPGTGYAYPSGHVLAAAVTWGFLPTIAAMYLHRPWIRRASRALAWSVIGLVAWSRVWLGVHWLSDVVGGICIAFVALALVQRLIERNNTYGELARRDRQSRTTVSYVGRTP